MRRHLPTLAALTCAAALLAAPASSAREAVEITPVAAGVRLIVRGRLITLFRTANGGLSPRRRAEIAAGRLKALIPAGLSAGDIEVRERGESWGVYASGSLVMIATPEEAAERKEDAEATARRWAANLAAALPRPAAKAAGRPGGGAGRPAARKPESPRPLALAADSLIVPLGEARVMAVKGTLRGELSVRTEGGESISARPSPAGDGIEVRGSAPGRAVVHVERGGARAAFTVWVRKYAGRVAGTPTAQVTGVSTPAALVRKAAEERLREELLLEPGASVVFSGPPEGLRSLAGGTSLQLSVPITISGPEYIPVRTTARVRVENLVLPPQDAAVLLYSNDPESVREYGVLFEGAIDPDGPARWLFHHQNRMGRPFTFALHLVNPNETPVEAQVIAGDSGPFIDTIQVGHRAAQRYMEAASRDVGTITRIPGRSTKTLYSTVIPERLTVSGIYNVRILSGGPLVAQVSAAPDASRPEITPDLLEAARSEPDVYPSPQKDERHRYAVGERWTFIPLGRKAIQGRMANKKLFGNYGVLYNLTVDLENPTDVEKTVQVVLAAEAGWTRGVFIIDGKLVEAPQIAPPIEAVLWSTRLAPREQRRIRIQGIPIGGSAYPVSLVIRS